MNNIVSTRKALELESVKVYMHKHRNKAHSQVPETKKLKQAVLCRSTLGSIDYTVFLLLLYLGYWGQLLF